MEREKIKGMHEGKNKPKIKKKERKKERKKASLPIAIQRRQFNLHAYNDQSKTWRSQ